MGKKNEGRKYNGWANRVTWAVKSWLDEQGPGHRHWVEQARHLRGRDDAACRLSWQLRYEVARVVPSDEVSRDHDLLWAHLEEVDWLELAESYLDEVEPGEDEADWTGGGESCDGPAMPEPRPERRPNDQEPTAPPENLAAEGLFGELIFAYTRKQAIADGVLIDVTETAKEAGFRVPVALTRAAWAEYVAVPEGVECQDEAGRLWDIVWMGRHGISQGKNRDASEALFQLHVRNDNREGMPPLVTLKAVIGPDDDGEPCITIMMPDED